jgi:hypothetical protein
MLTFNAEVKEKMTDPELIFNLVEILKQVEVVKVRRMTIATLRVSIECNNYASFSVVHCADSANRTCWTWATTTNK